MKIFISGKVTGDKNYKYKFKRAEEEVSSKYALFEPKVESMPSKDYLRLNDKTWDECMIECLKCLDSCDTIYMLRDWEDSKGACIEIGYALGQNKIVIFQE
ncbi:DUF4406 domain-containing protein [Anaerovoracaceae bacterium SGI.195]